MISLDTEAQYKSRNLIDDYGFARFYLLILGYRVFHFFFISLGGESGVLGHYVCIDIFWDGRLMNGYPLC